MEHCGKCGREVKETIHTQDSWVVDYFRKFKDGRVVETLCVECHNKELKK